MAKFRKKPVVIDAVPVSGMLEVVPMTGWPEWLLAAWAREEVAFKRELGTRKPVGFRIRTPEGEMTADYSDWIIRGVDGDLYPCTSDNFQAEYEPVED